MGKENVSTYRNLRQGEWSYRGREDAKVGLTMTTKHHRLPAEIGAFQSQCGLRVLAFHK